MTFLNVTFDVDRRKSDLVLKSAKNNSNECYSHSEYIKRAVSKHGPGSVQKGQISKGLQTQKASAQSFKGLLNRCSPIQTPKRLLCPKPTITTSTRRLLNQKSSLETPKRLLNRKSAIQTPKGLLNQKSTIQTPKGSLNQNSTIQILKSLPTQHTIMKNVKLKDNDTKLKFQMTKNQLSVFEFGKSKEVKIESRPTKCAKIESRPTKCAKIESRPTKCAKIESRPTKCAKIESRPTKCAKITTRTRSFKEIDKTIGENAKIQENMLDETFEIISAKNNIELSATDYHRSTDFSISSKSELNTTFSVLEQTPQCNHKQMCEENFLNSTCPTTANLCNRMEQNSSTARKRELNHIVGIPQSSPMSIKTKALSTKESFAKLSRFVLPYTPFQTKRSFTPKLVEPIEQVILKKMGNTNVKRVPSKLPLTLEEQQYIKRSLQRRRNGQREVHKNMWRAEKRALASESIRLSDELARARFSKRTTYKKGKNSSSSGEGLYSVSRTFPKNVAPSMIHTDSLTSSLPSRSDISPPDGDSLQSDAEKSRVSLEPCQKCESCIDSQTKLSKAYAHKGAIAVALEKTRNDFLSSQKKVKDLEKDLEDAINEKEQALSIAKNLEAEISSVQKDKAEFLHDLNSAEKQLRTLEQSNVSDFLPERPLYVSGSRKTLDDGLGDDASPDDEGYDGESGPSLRKMRDELDFLRGEVKECEKLKNAEIENDRLKISMKLCQERIIDLEGTIKALSKFPDDGKEAGTQTIKRDGTFTRQPSDKTKIPRWSHHSSLPVIPDPSATLTKKQPSTINISRFNTLRKSVEMKEFELSNMKQEMSELEKELNMQNTCIYQNSGVSSLKAENDRLNKELQVVKDSYAKEMVMRKKYYNLAEDLKGKIRVYCRIRPPETKHKYSVVLESIDEYTVKIRTQRSKYEFMFDGVFTVEQSQEDVFRDVQNLVQSSLDGYNVCIFAYGQTGSGKTYTLIGNDSEPGIAPRAFKRMFELIRENQTDHSFYVSTSVLELYNEKLFDLLQEESEEKLKIRKDRNGLVYVQGAESKDVYNEAQLLDLFEEACNNRHTGSTRMNVESSRSHLILSVLISSTNITTGVQQKGKFTIVDLAGSERSGKTAAVTEQIKEANSINKSLSALGDVVAALNLKQFHVPYRNNKLTLLMQDSIGSNAKTLMFVNVSPTELNADETLNSLIYASRVKQVTNCTSKMAENKEIARLKSIIVKLSKESQHTNI